MRRVYDKNYNTIYDGDVVKVGEDKAKAYYENGVLHFRDNGDNVIKSLSCKDVIMDDEIEIINPKAENETGSLW
jgi:hypothetical protein